MKKINNDFKTLTKKETNQVKGGGWFSDMLSSWFGRDSSSAYMEAPADCPPPEPDSERDD